ncbi:MAG: diguanylate phosphodiesterase [Frankiales bacterium]|nr:diguanylate phosphodiesterase [Frankiales bacterium]
MTTPYQVVAAAEAVRRGDKGELVALSRRFERAALADPPAVVAATLQDARHLTEHTRAVYAQLAAAGSRATLYARELQSWVAEGVVGVSLDDDDPLVDEWVVVLPSSSSPVVFAATDLKEPCDIDLDRCFSYAVSRDPQVVDACAALLAPGRR